MALGVGRQRGLPQLRRRAHQAHAHQRYVLTAVVTVVGLISRANGLLYIFIFSTRNVLDIGRCVSLHYSVNYIILIFIKLNVIFN